MYIQVRTQWKDSRFFYGKNRVLQAALGRTEAEEYREGLSRLTKVYIYSYNMCIFLIQVNTCVCVGGVCLCVCLCVRFWDFQILSKYICVHAHVKSKSVSFSRLGIQVSGNCLVCLFIFFDL